MEQAVTAPTREQIQEMAHEAGLDWHKGFTGDPAAANRYEKLVNLAIAFSAAKSAPSGSGAELVREVERVRDESGPRWTAHALVQRWDRLRAALLDGDAAREDAARLDFYQSHPNMIGYATGYRGSVSEWYSRKDGYVTNAPTLREAIDRARGGGDA